MIEFDLSLIHDLTDEDAQISRPLVVTEFQRAGKHLYYINANHVSGINNSTCETVKQAITQFNPDFIVIEGVEAGAEVGSSFVKFVKEQAPLDFKRGGEPAYTAHLAMENSIPFSGGEPSFPVIFASMEEAGYSAKEVMAFYLLQSIPQWWREGTMDEKNFDAIAMHYLEWFRRASGAPESEAMTFEEFTQWFKTHNTTGRGFLQIENDDLRPTDSVTATYFQRMQHTMGPVRERHIDTVIANAFTGHDRVLVVYGNGHFLKSRPVFEKAFGPGIIAMQLA